jgi:hypothetical protein
MTAAWGESGTAGEGEHHLPGEVNLGRFEAGAPDSTLVFNPAGLRELLHSQETVNAVTARANEICDDANNNVALDPRTVERLSATQEGPAYRVEVHNNPAQTRARAHVVTNGELGKLDQGVNLTLMKSVDGHSDAKGSHHE